MPNLSDRAWVRCRVPIDTKDFYRKVAFLLEWRVPGAESAGLSFVVTILTPLEFANQILAALGEPPLSDYAAADLELKGE